MDSHDSVSKPTPFSFFNQLLQLIPDGVFTWTPDKDETLFSPHLREMLGYPADLLLADWNEWISLVHPDDQDTVTHILQNSLQHSDHPFEFNIRLITAQSTTLKAHCRGCVVQDPESKKGRPTVVLTVEGNTNLPEALRVMWQTGKLYRTTINNIREIVFVVDSNRKVVLMNRIMKRALARYGMRDAKEGMSLEKLLQPYRPDYMERYEKVFAEGTILSFEAETEVEGKKLWGDWTQVPIKNQHGNVVFILTTVRDITSQKIAESDRKHFESEAIAQFHLTQLGLLAAELIHVMRNPLTILTVNNNIAKDNVIEVLNRGEVDPQVLYDTLDELVEKLSANQRGIERLNQLVEEIQDYTRVNSDLSESKVVDINAILEADAKMISVNSAINGDVEIRVSLSSSALNAKVPPYVITQIFLNLVNNGMEAMESSETRVLSIRSGQDDANVWFEVNDTGSGIPSHIHKNLGQPFLTTKADPETSALESRGSGLGIYMLLRSLKRFSGEMKAESEPGNTRIRIFFPRSDVSVETES
ncbi:MAG: ATP-binding protein [bacterium]